MACQRQLPSCFTRKFFRQPLSTLSYHRAVAAQPAVSSTQIRPAYQPSRRHKHHLKDNSNLATNTTALKRMTHYSAIASAQAAKKASQQDLKQRNQNTATNGTASTEPTAGSSEEQKNPVTVAFEQNSHWRRNLAELQPDLFKKLGKGQSPEILWIGCADSRCPETTILGLQPGDIFCHRNIANILVPTDLNSLSVIQYAVQYLKVKHIIVCGHTSCGGIAAALANKKLGLIDTWLMPLRHLRAQNAKMLEALPEKERGLKMVDLNVRRSVAVLMENPVVMEAMIDRGLQLHGVIYDVGSGELNELDIAEDEEIVEERKKAFKVEE